MHTHFKQNHIVGLILSSIPKLLKDVNNKHKFKLRYAFYLIFALTIGIITVLLEKHICC